MGPRHSDLDRRLELVLIGRLGVSKLRPHFRRPFASIAKFEATTIDLLRSLHGVAANMANPANENILLNHPTFGYLTGVQTADGPVQFGNLPYSDAPSRWTHSTPLSRLSNDLTSPYDATQWGPAPPQAENSIDFDFGLIQKRLPLNRELRYSETEGLNLVVTTPSLDVRDLPVMVLCVSIVTI